MRLKRRINGLLLLDKPIGPSSNRALQTVKHLYGAAKAGHTGSLDPLASGLLPICFGEATKFSQYLLDADKTYIVKAQLGIRTTTSDSEGEIVATKAVPDLTLKSLDRTLEAFRGTITQIPSMYSALKYQGKPLYKYAREGIEVPRTERTIEVYQLDVIAYESGMVTLAIRCSKGTYVRTIVDDLGEVLGCGAHVIALRRTSIGDFKEADMMTIAHLEQLKSDVSYQAIDDLLLPVETAISALPPVFLHPDLVHYLQQGSPVLVPNLPRGAWLRLHTKEGALIGIGELLDDGRIAPKRLLSQH
jgi:tRNA pseudouridine55 synthase